MWVGSTWLGLLEGGLIVTLHDSFINQSCLRATCVFPRGGWVGVGLQAVSSRGFGNISALGRLKLLVAQLSSWVQEA